MTNNIQGEEQQEKVMLMQVTVTNNDTIMSVRLLFLVDEVNVIRFQTTALHTANGFDTPVHHSLLGGCLPFTHIHMYIVIVSCFLLLSSELFNVLWGIFLLKDHELCGRFIHEQLNQLSLDYLLKGQSFLLFWTFRYFILLYSY